MTDFPLLQAAPPSVASVKAGSSSAEGPRATDGAFGQMVDEPVVRGHGGEGGRERAAAGSGEDGHGRSESGGPNDPDDQADVLPTDGFAAIEAAAKGPRGAEPQVPAHWGPIPSAAKAMQDGDPGAGASWKPPLQPPARIPAEDLKGGAASAIDREMIEPHRAVSAGDRLAAAPVPAGEEGHPAARPPADPNSPARGERVPQSADFRNSPAPIPVWRQEAATADVQDRSAPIVQPSSQQAGLLPPGVGGSHRQFPAAGAAVAMPATDAGGEGRRRDVRAGSEAREGSTERSRLVAPSNLHPVSGPAVPGGPPPSAGQTGGPGQPPASLVEMSQRDIGPDMQADGIVSNTGSAVQGAATHGPSLAASPHIAQQVARQMAMSVVPLPGGPVEIRLSPEELGRVRLTVSVQDGIIAVAVLADRPETADLLRRNIETLAREFRDLGYEQSSFSFQDRKDRQDPAGRGQSGGPTDTGVAPPTDTARPAATTPHHPGSTGLDLRL